MDRIERAATRRGRAESRRSTIEGFRLHERALRAGFGVEAAVVSRAIADERDSRASRLLAQLSASDCELQVVPDEVLATLTEGRGLGDIVGLVAIPAPVALSHSLGEPHPVFLAACDVEEPGNTGALMRTTLAAGAAGLIAVGQTDPWHPKALRTSMGSVFKLPLYAADSAEDLVARLRALGGSTLAGVSRGGAVLPAWIPPPTPLALLLGGEARGLSPESRAAADGEVSIPMRPGVDSYSINAAAAILLYEAVGRRRPS